MSKSKTKEEMDRLRPGRSCYQEAEEENVSDQRRWRGMTRNCDPT